MKVRGEALKKTYKYRLYPNAEQTVLINKTFGSVLFVYNKNMILLIKIKRNEGTK
jgi:transposase